MEFFVSMGLLLFLLILVICWLVHFLKNWDYYLATGIEPDSDEDERQGAQESESPIEESNAFELGQKLINRGDSIQKQKEDEETRKIREELREKTEQIALIDKKIALLKQLSDTVAKDINFDAWIAEFAAGLGYSIEPDSGYFRGKEHIKDSEVNKLFASTERSKTYTLKRNIGRRGKHRWGRSSFTIYLRCYEEETSSIMKATVVLYYDNEHYWEFNPWLFKHNPEFEAAIEWIIARDYLMMDVPLGPSEGTWGNDHER